MPPTDTSAKGLESLIITALASATPPSPRIGRGVGGEGTSGASLAGINESLDSVTADQTGGFFEGDPHDYDRLHVLDLVKLLNFPNANLPDADPDHDEAW